MDSELNTSVQKLAMAHDLLALEVLGMMALIGAMMEISAPDPNRVAAWCDLVTRGQAGISQARVQEVADTILNYVRTHNAPQ